MPKFIFKMILMLFSSITLSHAAPEKAVGNIALHIAKMHYLHPVHLLHPYLDVWHMKGPLAEKAAMTALQQHYSNVSECNNKNGDGQSDASVVLLLEPHMFYNPQLQVFHAEFIARAYTSSGEPITRIKKQAEQIGALDIAPDFHMSKAYSKAINKVIEELATDQNFLTVLNQNGKINAGSICSGLDNQPLDKLYY